MFLSERIVKIIDWVAVVIFVTAATLVTVLRVYLPSLDEHKSSILPYITQELGIELSVDHINATWRDFGPVLIAKGVDIQDDPSYQLAKIESMEFQFNFWDSLWQGDIFFKKIRIAGATLDLTHTATKSEPSTSEFSVDTVEDYVSQIFGTQKGFFELADISLKLKDPDNELVELHIDHLLWRNINSTHNLEGQLHVDIDDSQLKLKGNVLVYLGAEQDWGVEAVSAAFQSNSDGWHPFSVKYLRQGYLNTINIDHILLQDLYPITHFFLESMHTEVEEKDAISGQLNDLRVAWGRELASPKVSFNLNDIAIKKTHQLPQIDQISLSVAGSLDAGTATLNIEDNTLFSSALFAKELALSPSHLGLNWYKKEQGYALWSENLEINSPNLDVDGRFWLDIPKQGEPFLSAYTNLSLKDVSHLADYFPENSVGVDTEAFLRSGFGAGYSQNARALWYGELPNYPFSEKQGILQVNADLKDVELTFAPEWPTIDKLDANFELRNEDIFIHSTYAQSMGVTGGKLSATIPHFLSTTWLELSGDLSADSGREAQKYLLQSPLNDSIAPALDSVQIEDRLAINLNLYIPFSGNDYRAWGYVDLDGNPLHIDTPSLDFTQAKGRLYYDNEKIRVKGLRANLYQQPLQVDLEGDQKGDNYLIDIKFNGNWDITTLNKSFELNALNYVSGKSRWDLDVDLDITRDDVLFKVRGEVQTDRITSELPYPLQKIATNRDGIAQNIKVALQGSDNAFSMDVRSPKISYASHYQVEQEEIAITSSVLTVGQDVKAEPQRRGQHRIYLDTDYADGDIWLPIIFDITESKPETQGKVSGLPVATPELVRMHIDRLKLGGLDWYQSAIDAWRKKRLWSLDVNSNEAVGTVEIYDNRPWLAHFEKLFVFYAGSDSEDSDNSSVISIPRLESAEASEFDKDLFRLMPDFTMKADDFWFQGYSLGQVAATVSRIGNDITWKDVSMAAGSIRGKSHGKWTIKNGNNYTHEYLEVTADNNSEILDRMGIEGGIRGSSVDFATDLNWHGTLWGMKRNTLEGNVSLKMGEGIVKSISGSTNLVGLLSLDSLLKKIRLDFSGIFEEGLAVESVDGYGTISQGLLTTTDSMVNTIPGDMKISGTMDFIDEKLDLRVNFVPDFASGVPVIAAFAVSPPVGVLAFAVSTVLSPVLDVVTEINYAVTGPFSAPQVNELSRNSGEIEVPQSQQE